MRPLSHREKIIFGLTVGVMIAGLAVQFVVRPLREKNDNISEQIEAAQKRLSKSRKLIEDANHLQNDYQKLVDILGKASSEGAEASMMVAKLEAAANEANVHIGNMQPQRAVAKGSLTVFSVDLVIDGSWPAITKFLYIVQSKPELLNLEEMNLEKIDSESKLRGRILLSRFRVN